MALSNGIKCEIDLQIIWEIIEGQLLQVEVQFSRFDVVVVVVTSFGVQKPEDESHITTFELQIAMPYKKIPDLV